MISRREFCQALGVSLLPSVLNAAPTPKDEVFVAKTFRNRRGDSLPYRIFVPQGSGGGGARRPIVLWLHGGAGPGNDNLKQISSGNRPGSHVWTAPSNQARNPCLVLAPQCPPNEFWTTLDTVRPKRPLALALELLDEVRRAYDVDERRVYVTGQSMGGYATWAAIAERPELFAAAVPVCGGGNGSDVQKFKRVPVWAFHGERDEAVDVARTRRMIDALRLAGAAPRYTEYKGAGHVIWEKVYGDPGLLPWVFAQVKPSP